MPSFNTQEVPIGQAENCVYCSVNQWRVVSMEHHSVGTEIKAQSLCLGTFILLGGRRHRILFYSSTPALIARISRGID